MFRALRISEQCDWKTEPSCEFLKCSLLYSHFIMNISQNKKIYLLLKILLTGYQQAPRYDALRHRQVFSHRFPRVLCLF